MAPTPQFESAFAPASRLELQLRERTTWSMLAIVLALLLPLASHFLLGAPLLYSLGLAVALLVLAKAIGRGPAAAVMADADLRGKTVVVTGANTGIGFETAAACIARGAHVVMTARSKARGVPPLEEIRRKAGMGGTAELVVMDLADLNSVLEAVEQIEANEVSVLIANAGVMMCPWDTTKQGFELQWGTNHVGHFVLVMRLLENIRRNSGRIVMLSSSAHQMAHQPLPFLSPEEYSRTTAYGHSKLSNLLFTRSLQARLTASGSDATVYAVHPGVVKTDLMRHLTLLVTLLEPLRAIMFKPADRGAATSLFCAFDDAALPGEYHFDCSPGPTSPAAMDMDSAQALWEYTVDVLNTAGFPTDF